MVSTDSSARSVRRESRPARCPGCPGCVGDGCVVEIDHSASSTAASPSSRLLRHSIHAISSFEANAPACPPGSAECDGCASVVGEPGTRQVEHQRRPAASIQVRAERRSNWCSVMLVSSSSGLATRTSGIQVGRVIEGARQEALPASVAVMTFTARSDMRWASAASKGTASV